MANNNMYHHNASSSFSWTEPDHEPDDISVFVRQILRPSSSSSSNFMNMKGSEMQYSSSLPNLLSKNQHGLESCSMLNTSSGNILSSFSGAYNIPTGVVNVCSSSVGTMDNDLDEYECESEGGTEDFVVEASGQQPSSSSSRNSSKRSRAAEVHNLSEKRRRSRINEKMKALQNLIPNSNKTDKASMLDEAIEYLKQLQLQVQMLTMKNGLFPLGLPRVLQQNQLSQQRMGLCEGDGFMKDNVASALHVNQDTSLKAIFSPSNNCTETKLTPVATMANVNLHNAFESESSINTHLDPFQLSRNSKGMWKEDWLPLHELNERPSTVSIGAHVASLAPFDTNASNLKSNTLEACLHRYQLGALNETNMDCDQLLAPHLYSHVGRSTSVDIIKNECSNF